MIKKFLFICIIGFAAVNLALAADGFKMPLTVTPEIYNFPGVQLDIRGLKLGMSRADAEKKMIELAAGTEAKTSQNSFGKGDVRSENFEDQIVAWGGMDKFEVLLTSPTSGNVVFMIARSAEIPVLQQPKIQEMQVALEKKYGKASSIQKSEDGMTMMWYLGKDGTCSPMLAECIEPNWKMADDMASISYSPSKSSEYEAYAEKADVLIVGRLGWEKGEDRVSNVVMSITDVKTRAETAEADVKLVESEIAKNSQ